MANIYKTHYDYNRKNQLTRNDDVLMCDYNGNYRKYNVSKMLDSIDQAVEAAKVSLNASRYVENPLDTHSKFLKTGRNLIEVFDNRFGNITTRGQVFDKIHEICISVGEWDTPDFSFIRIGDYLDLGQFDKTAGGTARTQAYSSDYATTYYKAENTRIVVAGFDQWLHIGDSFTRNHHVLWSFQDCITTHRYYSSNTTGYGGELYNWLHNATNGLLKDIQAVIPYDRILQYWCSYDAAWVAERFHIPHLFECYAEGEQWESYGGGRGDNRWNTNRRIPLYASGPGYLLKRFNGQFINWWTSSRSVTATSVIRANGQVDGGIASTLNNVGVSPTFCTW